MKTVAVEAKKDHIQSLSHSPRPLQALSELIWNGFDAQAENVTTDFTFNDLDTLEEIKVQDDGTGITFDNVDILFGGLGDSWKKGERKVKGRSLHGKNGKGRFKSFGLGTSVTWTTRYQDDNKVFEYTISGRADAPTAFNVTTPVEVNKPTGTEVKISNIAKNFTSLFSNSSFSEVNKVFASYLTEYQHLTLTYNGQKIIPQEVQEKSDSYNLGDVKFPSGKTYPLEIQIIQWAMPTDRIVHLCDLNGVTLEDIKPGAKIKAPGYDYSAYVRCDLVRDLDKEGLLVMREANPDYEFLVSLSFEKVKEHFRRLVAAKKSALVQRWKQEQIYPYKENAADPSKEAEQQVFDIVAANVEQYLPKFDVADTKSRKFTFKLIAQALQENPESLQKILIEVLDLSPQAQDDLAGLLNHTSLTSIISTAKVVADRLNFLEGLEYLLFDKENKQNLLERDQLHKILENEAWIFSEDFALSTSETRLEEVLQKHIAILGERVDEPVHVGEEEKQGRIDLMLSRTVQPRKGEHDYLVVELKRPKQKIDNSVYNQISDYAVAVANDERFQKVPARWTFIAVSNELTPNVKAKCYNQKNDPDGLIMDIESPRIQCWVKPWSEIIQNARTRLQFINEQLDYQVSLDSAKEYLIKTHEKYIPSETSEEDE